MSTNGLTIGKSALQMIAESLGVKPGAGCGCCVCGQSSFNKGGRLATGFSDYELIADPSSREACEGCTRILAGRPGDSPPPLRTTSFGVWRNELVTLDRAGLWSTLMNPPSDSFVLSFAASRQKHHALRAGVSTPRWYRIGGDGGTIDYVPSRESPLVDSVLSMLSRVPDAKPFFSRSAIISGDYHPSAVERYGILRFRADEGIIQPYRAGRRDLLSMLLWCAPSEERETEMESVMIDPNDATAARLIGAIARGSQVRISDGKSFWSGFFARRINRHRHKHLQDIVAGLLADCETPAMSEGAQRAAAILAGLDEQSEAAVAASIRDRSALVLTLSYDERRIEE